MNKIEARKYALKARKTKDLTLASNVVVEALVSSKILEKYNNIGLYYALKGEIDILGLMDYYPNKNFYLPKTLENIVFIKYDKNTPLEKGAFNVYEPIGDIVKKEDIEVFLVPCVAISCAKKRIGYGKGYYDRYLENYKGLKIGIVIKEANNLDVLLDEFDINLDYVFEG